MVALEVEAILSTLKKQQEIFKYEKSNKTQANDVNQLVKELEGASGQVRRKRTMPNAGSTTD